MRSMKGTFWKGVGVLVIFALFILTPLANAGGKGGGSIGPTIILPQVEGWWDVSLFGTSLNNKKERGVIAEDMWVFVGRLACQDTQCQADIRVFKEDAWEWKEIGSGNLSLPPSGNNLWYNFYFYETGDYYYGNAFHFGNEMEGDFTGDKRDCPQGVSYCILTCRASGRITFKK